MRWFRPGLILVAGVLLLGAGCSKGGNNSIEAAVGPSTSSGAATATTAVASTSRSAALETLTTAAGTSSSGLAGTWAGTYQQTSPAPANGTFTIQWQQTGANLAGNISIDGSCSNCPISATVSGNSVNFGVVAAGVIEYVGTVSGNSMSGTFSTSDGAYKGTWKANKSS